MLEAAGVRFEVLKPDVDEDASKARLRDAGEIASELAAAKATSIGRRRWVIGSDSVVSADGRLFDVAESTGTRGFVQRDYLRRAAILDRDPRGGAFAMLFAAEMAGLE